MMKHLRYMAVAALATVGTACSEAPTDVNEEFDGELVITEGIAAPEYRSRPVLSEVALASSNLGGGTLSRVSLKSQYCVPKPAPQPVVITYTITGNQVGTATFDVNTMWVYNNGGWSGSVPTTVTVLPQSGGTTTLKQVTLSLLNESESDAGPTAFVVDPSDPINSNVTGAKLTVGSSANVTIYVDLVNCAVVNTPPTISVPPTVIVEATSSSGAIATYSGVTATDLQDGDLTSSVVCTPASGEQFELGETVVSCSVTDNGGLTATETFKVIVDDTTPPLFTNFPSSPVSLIATSIAGAELDIASLGITVQDVNQVSEPSTFTCDYEAGTMLAIGSSTPVKCRAKDADGNETPLATAPSFVVTVGLNVNATGFLPPLRMFGPFSVHKRGSTIPHKFFPPTYADGTPAIDLASGLSLRVSRLDAVVEVNGIEETEYSAGSTVWRYDAESGHYIFNLKTSTSSPWESGTWMTKVSYAGITLAQTQFDLKK